ncbi:aspartic proteinase-like protein 1 isoform X2 [Trifolium pratense]|uniref:aspartic proteinase-like protein 1 isoform X2 n=1 Tax=Trifolium pratense TaxID=57577 RepID=UPI001E691D70|nr:aspartic proteinase-like protein 1 isoform X2 [Trifolium pratense]
MSSRWRFFLLFLLSFTVAYAMPVPTTFSVRLVHRFSEEMKPVRVSTSDWPDRRSMRYYRMLLENDFLRHKINLGAARHQFLFPSQGSKTMSFGNDFGWLHYTWIDIGTPSTSFLVALDAGSDRLWVPCDCIQCAPLSASFYSNLDRDLNEYSPSRSLSSKHLSCSHRLCDTGSNCKTNKQQCPYTVNYLSENTSSSGLLVEDILHLQSSDGSSGSKSNSSVQAPVVFGCGMKQSGGYLDGVAPDGLIGLGPGESSVPSFLAKSGLIRDSFSLCFNEDDSGRLFFGDQGPTVQQSTPFLPLDGMFSTYIIGVEACCIGSSCPKVTSFNAQFDSGTSFTLLPGHAYGAIAEEFDKQVNATRSTFQGSPWEYCYEPSSQQLPKIPTLTLMFQQNNSFVVYNPVFVSYNNQGIDGFCLAIQPADGDLGIIGQNFMTGYRLVFDRENKKLAWSHSNCQDLSLGKRMPISPSNGSSSNPLPADEQQRTKGHAVAPAVAGRAPQTPSVVSSQISQMVSYRQHWHYYWLLLFQLLSVFY